MNPAPTSPAPPTWTEAQHAAIRHDWGDLLVSAAAGSGKTAVLAERCARLVCEGTQNGERCGVDQLLVLTFTEAAANEMKSRIADAIRQKSRAAKQHPKSADDLRWLRRQEAMVDRAGISTLHGFCLKVLKAHFHEAQIDPGFEIIDADEAALLQEEVLDALFAQWHQPPTPAQPPWGFGEFLEAYGQGRDATCRDFILKMYHMLASTADPAAYLAAARAAYTTGTDAAFDGYMTEVICGKFRLLAATAKRVAEEVEREVGVGQMSAHLRKIETLLKWAHEEMSQKGEASWDTVRIALSNKWENCKTVKEYNDFDALKKRTWVALKTQVDTFCSDILGANPAHMRTDLAALAPSLEALLRMTTEFQTAFTHAKRAQNRVDFHDLERLTLDLLSHPAGSGAMAVHELRAKYKHVLVDEFQDINPLQAALLAAVTSVGTQGGNLFVVGDVKQSIYGFRLADPRLFLAREKRARAKADGAGTHLALQHNFRSRAGLLAVMNGLFERLLTEAVAEIDYTAGHALVAGAAAKDPPRPVEVHLVVMEDEDDADDESEEKEKEKDKSPEPAAENLSAVEHEAQMVAARIAEMVATSFPIREKNGATRPIRYSDIAILLRSVKTKAMLFARALDRRGIDAHADLSTGYFDAPEVSGTLALLHVLDNPKQDVPLATVMLGPYADFSHDDLALIRLTFDRRELSFAEAVARYAAPPEDVITTHGDFSTLLSDRVKAFFHTLTRWREKLAGRPLHEGLSEIYSESKILARVSAQDGGTQRVANLQMLHQRALKFSSFRKQGLHRFLRFLDKLRQQDQDFGEAPVVSQAANAVRIMSVHKSKGLEFPIVFVSGLGGKLILDEGGLVRVHRELGVGLAVIDVEKNVFYPSPASARIAQALTRTSRAEELRLLYVALTRARDHLLLTGHINKTARLTRWQSQWNAHTGPIPEDVLLKGQNALDWLMPALCCSGNGGNHRLSVRWNEPPTPTDHIHVTLHTPTRSTLSILPDAAAHAARTDHLRTGLPLDDAIPPGKIIARLMTRVLGTYAHAALATQPAVQTVSFLKTLHVEEHADLILEEPPEPFDAATPPDPALAERARLRGIATHRVLEHIDFPACATALDAHLQTLLAANILTQDDLDTADLPGIRWFLTQSAAGKRIIAAAARHAAGEKCLLRRELPFTWAAPPTATTSSADPADWPTIRGVIDLLVVDPASRTAELFDYKTDSLAMWQRRLPDYQRQMTYYLQAAADILGYPVTQATLLFLSPRVEQVVTLP